MKKNMFGLVITVFFAVNLYAGANYDGGIIAGDQIDLTIYIFKGDTPTLDDSAVLWSWNQADDKVADVAKEDLFGRATDAKRVLGGSHILATLGSYVVLIRIEDKAVVFYAQPKTHLHSAELLPDGNIVTAGSNGYLKLYSRKAGSMADPIQTLDFRFAHGVAWDHEGDCLWALGHSLGKFKYDRSDPSKPFLVPVTAKVIKNANHDLFPVPGERDLYLTGKDVTVYDIDSDTASVLSTKGPKAVSQNGPGGEIIYSQGVGKNKVYASNGDRLKRWQSPDVKSFGGQMRTRKGAAFYKARWFVPCSFSYPEDINGGDDKATKDEARAKKTRNKKQ